MTCWKRPSFGAGEVEEDSWVVAGAWGRESKLTTEGMEELFGVMVPFCILHVMVLQDYAFVKTPGAIPLFKRVNFTEIIS